MCKNCEQFSQASLHFAANYDFFFPELTALTTTDSVFLRHYHQRLAFRGKLLDATRMMSKGSRLHLCEALTEAVTSLDIKKCICSSLWPSPGTRFCGYARSCFKNTSLGEAKRFFVLNISLERNKGNF
jgi:hypothetical protein